jgi:4-hydroxy-tetrahydrodipicolinate synthase
MELRGVHTALVTPFSDGAIDLDSFAALCTRQIDAGINGLVPCGTTGETPTLTSEEWAELVSTTVRVADGRVPVTAGCGTNSTATTVFPYYNKPNPPGLRAHVAAACKPGLPVVLYHVPGRTGQRLDAGTLVELCHTPGVIAVKEATGDVELGQRLVNLGISVLSGDDFTFPALMSVGGAGVISVISNLAPEMTVALARAAAAGDRDAISRINPRLQPVVDYLFSESNPVPCKAALAAMGLCSDELRLPLAAGTAPPAALLEGLK